MQLDHLTPPTLSHELEQMVIVDVGLEEDFSHPKLNELVDVDSLAIPGEDHYANGLPLRIGPQMLQEGHAVHYRHHQVEDDGIRQALWEDCQRFLAIARTLDLMPLKPQELNQRFQAIERVIYNKDAAHV